MPSYSPSDFLKKLRSLKQQTSSKRALHHHSTATGVLVVSGPVLACGSFQPPRQEQTVISAIYRNTSDAAQTFLPPVQAVADMIPGVGGIIKGAIGGILSSLQLVDKYIQNKGDLATLTRRLYRLCRHIDNAPTAHTGAEEDLRWELLCALQTAKSQLERMGKRIRGSPSLTQEITGCITTINNYLFEYMALSQMQLQNDVFEIKTNVAEFHFRQMQFIENVMATGGAGRVPAVISRGHAILVDATGREHTMFLDQCRHLDQLDAMLRASLFQCRPDEAEIQSWYIERKQYDFVIYKSNNSDVIQLTRESDLWSNMEPGTRIVMRVINEEFAGLGVRATYKCPCGTSNTINVEIGNLVAALQRGCTITCWHCERRFQITHTQGRQTAVDSTDSQQGTDTTPTAVAMSLIRNFIVKQVALTNQVMPPWIPPAMSRLVEKYPDDRFELVLRKWLQEWRLKCLDCPGKLYYVGPGESLANYEVHLKNRQHVRNRRAATSRRDSESGK